MAAEEELAQVQTRLQPSNHQIAIAELRSNFAESKDMTLRIRLAGAVKAVMDQIEVDRDGNATVSVMDRKRVYRFAIAKKVTSFELVSGSTTMVGGFIDVGGEAEFRASLAA